MSHGHASRPAALFRSSQSSDYLAMLRLFRPSRVSLKSCDAQRKASLSSVSNISTPWFIEQEYTQARQHPPHLTSDAPQEKSLPSDLPAYLTTLHSELSRSPHLERGGVEICPPLPTEPGPPLPSALPKGRRKRGRTEFGLGVPDLGGGLWRWIVIAQVKEGTENRGAIESVMRIVRKTLLMADPPVSLPPNKKRRVQDGWGMLDAGDFAVHILSRSAREKYFPMGSQVRQWQC